ncbi:3-hydroxyacyl-CoA dehydrogenase family protein [Bordetella flabilis]|uniref:3-hydroxyacyl-CoA dehydrogenase n=1 Tax=Bordetella flabilis TaxID=463014 RepID=A0A193GDB3_9BORD|nr:3-hydroxyacyl-CoA dehydrogenase family protein [Bordetella flabilis]ANN77805.1 3-hydroxyacyl-CoA dehydrogenase [Bordetella flabilis]
MRYQIVRAGASRSFPSPHAFLEQASPGAENVVYLGVDAGSGYTAGAGHAKCMFVAIELGTECLGVHTGEDQGQEGSNVVGFARFRLGTAEPSPLVELVRQPATRPEAIEAAKAAFQAAGLTVAVCGDFPGRIVDRLIRPYFNAALRRLDEKLASARDLDKTLCLGLGYPEGPISLLERTGLADHFRVAQSLYEALGQEAYAPARRAQVAARRALSAPGDSRSHLR